jgi:Ser/Thr protein kinase RdoA (MazF antagonist)
LLIIHGDLQITHVFVDGDEVTGIIDWSEASQGAALYDLATLTLAREEQLDDVIAGYGAGADLDLIRAWWSFRPIERWLRGVQLRHGSAHDRERFGGADVRPRVAREVGVLGRAGRGDLDPVYALGPGLVLVRPA